MQKGLMLWTKSEKKTAKAIVNKTYIIYTKTTTTTKEKKILKAWIMKIFMLFLCLDGYFVMHCSWKFWSWKKKKYLWIMKNLKAIHNS